MIKMSMKSCWFDSAEITKRMDAATRRVLSRFGSYMRKVARHSIRTRKGASQPGEPPHGHSGLLKSFIFYGYDKASGSFAVGGTVIIGPEKLSGRASETALSALEYGGRTTTVESRYRPGERRTKVYKQITIEARPFMGPAFERSKQQLPELWQDCLHRLGT